MVQRVHNASVTVEDTVVARISRGLLVFLGISGSDSPSDLEWLANKIIDLRIFPDEKYRMNRSLRDVSGELLVVSQFTLYGDVTKGRRPSFDKAADPSYARKMYTEFLAHCAPQVLTRSGVFQAHMDVSLTNDGPVTLILDSSHRTRKIKDTA